LQEVHTIKTLVIEPFKPADSSTFCANQEKNIRKKTTVYLENDLLRSFLIARKKVEIKKKMVVD
jgi:hypothetical protein